MRPGAFEIGTQSEIVVAVSGRERVSLHALAQLRHRLLALEHDREPFVPAPFQLSRHQTVVRIDRIVLAARPTLLEPTLADAILDRLVYNAYRLKLNGESMRKKRLGLIATASSE